MTTYYYDPKVTRAEKEEQDADIKGKIEQIRITFPKAGYRPLLHHLKRNGVIIGETKLRRIIKQVKEKRSPFEPLKALLFSKYFLVYLS